MIPRFTWPWGRISPARRLEELDRMIQRHQATIRIIQAQTQEAIRFHGKTIEALQGHKKIAEAFLDEEKRKSIMERAYSIEAKGIPVLDRISQALSIGEIEKILDEYMTPPSEQSLRLPLPGPKIEALEDNPSDLFAAGLDDDLSLFDPPQGESQ